jgi:protein TonB
LGCFLWVKRFIFSTFEGLLGAFMASYATEQPSNRLSWLNIVSLTAAFFVYAGMFLLVLTPGSAPEARADTEDDTLDVIFVPTPQKLEIPKMPESPIVVRKTRAPKVPTLTRTVQEKPEFSDPLPMAQQAPTSELPGPDALEIPDALASEDPSARDQYPIRYPARAMRSQAQGLVQLRVLVGADGMPLKVELQKSSRSRDLDQAAMLGVKRWKFNPEIKNGQPVEGWVIVPINFTFNEG